MSNTLVIRNKEDYQLRDEVKVQLFRKLHFLIRASVRPFSNVDRHECLTDAAKGFS